MNSGNAIEVKNISKSFKVYLDKGRTLKEKILFQKRRRYEKRTVLNNINFEVKKGEAIGLIGQNGCGKSTTLKLLTRIMYPDSGTIEMAGRVSSLIELGAGFHPDMSGRQNIYINASIFGLTRKEIDARLNDIIAFSEMEEFIDNPVRTYSSGMYMRLAFSVAINVNADILLIDEILAVGDANFQTKCFNKLREIKAKGVTIVIVSHSLGQIEQICERSIWIHKGRIELDGSPYDVHQKYLSFMGNLKSNADVKATEANNDEEKHQNIAPKNVMDSEQRWGNEKIHLFNCRLLDHAGNDKVNFETGTSMVINFKYIINEIIDNPVFGIAIFRTDNLRCYGTNTSIDNLPIELIPNNGNIKFTITKLMLLPGEYFIDIAVSTKEGEMADYIRNVRKFTVFSTICDEGIVRLEHTWNGGK